ncbi:hypothetical protein [Streptomyces silvisoli]|uniref:Lipoprotein n=1 Tax=Streptomyces silvisoli TaxID=3034235 RepID=A0ABT5ZTS9_9ACTN|nr:hypothetical protein [Streptomyces silvisoli]MDF3293227.1 hypothetical protein [Streptomyces silvisoli]
MRVRTRVSSLVLVMSGVLLVAGCGSGSDGGGGKDDVASVDKKGTSAPPVDKETTYRKYASCLRDQGISGVKVDDNGVGLSASSANGEGSGGQSDAQAIDKAMQVCNKKVPGMQQLQAQRDEKAVQDARKFAACARKNGIPDMADPAVVNGAPQLKTPDVPPETWNKVLEKCKEYMSGGMGVVNPGGNGK